MSNKNLCPICGQGQLHANVELIEVEVHGDIVFSPLHFSDCDSCGSETATAEQVNRNKELMLELRDSRYKQTENFLKKLLQLPK